MIVQYLSEYIAAMAGDGSKIAEFEARFGYTPKPYLRDGIQDSRYYHLSNKYPNESSRYEAAVRLLAVVANESKVAPPRGKQREVIRQWLLWLCRRQVFNGVEELVVLCKKETAVGSVDTINSIIDQTLELTEWRKAGPLANERRSKWDDEVTPEVADTQAEVQAANGRADSNSADLALLEKFKNGESYQGANAKDKRAMKKAFAEMTYEERVLYFALD